MSNSNVFLGTLTLNDHLHSRMAKAFFSHATKQHNVLIRVQPGSLLANSYNTLLTQALNLREKHNLTWFAILHADIAPEDWWLDKLIELAEKHKADVMSAVVPIKEGSGVTSTGISGLDDFVGRIRLTQRQIYLPVIPPTFDSDTVIPATFDIDILRDVMKIMPPEYKIPIPDSARLLVNTGCFVCRLDREWSNLVEFTIRDRICCYDGFYRPEVEPEDWYFSRRVAELGGRVMATREVTTQHFGGISYDNSKQWGSAIDPTHG